jgi:hypothetical protein
MRSLTFLFCCLASLTPVPGVAEPPTDSYGRALADDNGPISYIWDGQNWLKRVGFNSPIVITGEPQPPPLTQAMPSDVPPQGYSLSPWTAHDPGGWAEAVAIGDVTGDGRNDVLLTTTSSADPNNDYNLYVYPQLSNGTLDVPVPYSYNATATRNGIVVVDLNKDDRLDVVVGHALGITVFLGDVQSTGLQPGVVVVDADADTLSSMDVNRDGNPDIISLGWDRGASIFFGNGSGGFSSIEALPTNASGFNDHEVEDLNNDGVTDLAVMSGQLYETPNLSVHPHDTVSGFITDPDTYFMGVNELSWGLGLGDVTGDKLHDAVLSRPLNSPTHLWIMAQDQSGVLSGPTTISSYDIPESVEVSDLDGDGLEDVAVLHGGWNQLGIYLQGAAGLEPEVLYPIPYASHYAPQGLAVGDFSSDGCTDVAIADYNSGLVVLYGMKCNLIFKDDFESGN